MVLLSCGRREVLLIICDESILCRLLVSFVVDMVVPESEQPASKPTSSKKIETRILLPRCCKGIALLNIGAGAVFNRIAGAVGQRAAVII